jgi:hypothetical protein
MKQTFCDATAWTILATFRVPMTPAARRPQTLRATFDGTLIRFTGGALVGTRYSPATDHLHVDAAWRTYVAQNYYRGANPARITRERLDAAKGTPDVP